MHQEILNILKRNVEEHVYQNIEQNYEEWKHLSLFELGIESLDYMGILVDLESNYNLSIDDIENLDTLAHMEDILLRGAKQDA